MWRSHPEATSVIIALGLSDGRVQIESISGATPARLLNTHDAEAGYPVSDISLNSDGRMVAAAWGLGVVARRWNVDEGTSIGRPLVSELAAELVLYADDVLHPAGGAVQSFDPMTSEPTSEPRLIPGGGETGARLTSAGAHLQVVGAGHRRARGQRRSSNYH